MSSSLKKETLLHFVLSDYISLCTYIFVCVRSLIFSEEEEEEGGGVGGGGGGGAEE